MCILSLTPQKFIRRRREVRKSGSTPLLWLKQHISEIDLGIMIEDAKGAHPIHLNKNESVLDHFGTLRQGGRSWLRHRWDWHKLKEHFSGVSTYYFSGAPERFKRRILFMLDVDCKRRGCPEAAQDFLKYLASKECRREYGIWFPGLYRETSTNGRGGHGFALLDKCDYSPEFVNKLLLQRLQPLLNRIAFEKDFDIEFVEIKGTMPVVSWGDEKYEVLSYQSGCLAKLPREAEARFDELRNTAVITAEELLRFPSVDQIAFRPKKQNPSDPLPGSVTGKHISEELLTSLQKGGRFQFLAEKLLGTQKLHTSGRQIATKEDLAIALMFGEFFTNDMPTNGAMPEERWSKMWKSLYECGDLGRAWCHKRFKAIRDYLSSLGLLNWEDEEYVVGWYDENGEYHNGKASKWRFSEELMKMLSGNQGVAEQQALRCLIVEKEKAEGMIVEPEIEIVESGFVESRAVENRLVDKGEGGHPLWEQSIEEWIKSLYRQSDEETIRPIERLNPAIYRFNPDEISRFVAPYVALAA